MATCPVPEGSVVAEKYRIERVLGEGGMGVVVAAWHTELEQRVAIKFLWADIAQSAGASERFRREARAAAKIKSEHVGRVLDVGTLETGVPYMVMEYLEGRDLGDEVRARSRLPFTEAVEYVLQACEALAEAHVNNIVHRDLKPENLYLTSRADGTRLVKVLDFGVSKSLVDSAERMKLTKTSTLVGSPLYMSPEQLDAAKDIDARVDVWALGVILYELISGSTPFSGSTIPQLCNALMNSDPRPLRDLGIEVPEGLWSVIRRALEKKRADRWASIAELARALSPYAPPESSTSITRIERVLGGGRMGSTAGQGTVQSYEQAPATIKDSAAGSHQGLTQTTGDAVITQPDGTLASWGHTQKPATTRQEPAKRRVLWPVAALVPFLGLALYLLLLRPAAEPTESDPNEATAAGAGLPIDNAKSTTESKAPPEPVVSVDPTPEVKATEPEPTASAPAKAPETKHPTVAAAPRVVPVQRAVPRHAPRPPPQPSPKVAPTAAAAPAASSEFTDFGGRR